MHIRTTLGALLLLGCGDDADSMEEPELAVQARANLEKCEFIVEDEFEDDFVATSELDRCVGACFVNAPCGDLQLTLCARGPSSFSICLEQCRALHPFVCESGATISADTYCDGEPDCSDGSDEQECGAPLPIFCSEGMRVGS